MLETEINIICNYDSDFSCPTEPAVYPENQTLFIQVGVWNKSTFHFIFNFRLVLAKFTSMLRFFLSWECFSHFLSLKTQISSQHMLSVLQIVCMVFKSSVKIKMVVDPMHLVSKKSKQNMSCTIYRKKDKCKMFPKLMDNYVNKHNCDFCHRWAALMSKILCHT